jgi:hypothetical protein
MSSAYDDEPLSSDERAAEKAAQEQQQAVAAAILSALLLLRPQVTTVTYWIPVTWDEFRQAAGAAIDPAFNAFDKAARAVWMGYDSLDSATLEIQRRMKEKFVQEFGDSSRRAVEKAIEWGRTNGVTGSDMDRILAHIVGTNGNQAGGILTNWIAMQESGASPGLLDKMLADAAKTALKDRAGTVAGDVLWDAVQSGRMAGGMQEQRATNAQIVKQWWAVLDERQCGQCGALHGQVRPIGEAFPGALMAPRAHSMCRCRLRISVAEEGAF